MPREALAKVMRAAIASGDMHQALATHGANLSPAQKTALGKVTAQELAAIKSITSKGLDLPGDKLS